MLNLLSPKDPNSVALNFCSICFRDFEDILFLPYTVSGCKDSYLDSSMRCASSVLLRRYLTECGIKFVFDVYFLKGFYWMFCLTYAFTRTLGLHEPTVYTIMFRGSIISSYTFKPKWRHPLRRRARPAKNGNGQVVRVPSLFDHEERLEAKLLLYTTLLYSCLGQQSFIFKKCTTLLLLYFGQQTCQVWFQTL